MKEATFSGFSLGANGPLTDDEDDVTAAVDISHNGAAVEQMPGLYASDVVMRTEGDTLFVSGDVDLYQAPRFRQEAERYVRFAAQPRIDMSAVPFLDSAGLAVLLVLARQTRELGKSLRVVATGSPRRVLHITGIDRVLVMEDSNETGEDD